MIGVPLHMLFGRESAEDRLAFYEGLLRGLKSQEALALVEGRGVPLQALVSHRQEYEQLLHAQIEFARAQMRAGVMAHKMEGEA